LASSARAPQASTLLELDQALAYADLPAARALAVAARITKGELAVRAAALGHAALATEQATSVLAANPDDADAWTAALVASDLVGDGDAFQHLLRRAQANPTALHGLSVRLLAELVARHVGKPVKAFSIDFNWGDNGASPPGLYAQADPTEHVRWYQDLGANVIQTFCVSYNGYAWYPSDVAPVTPGLL
jgi:hypothetical protein